MVRTKREAADAGRPSMRFRGKKDRRFNTGRGMMKFIKRAMLKQCETKHVTQGVENLQLVHNALKLPFTSIFQVTQVDDEHERTEDEVIGRYLKIELGFLVS
jgi:hypothetical protein